MFPFLTSPPPRLRSLFISIYIFRNLTNIFLERKKKKKNRVYSLHQNILDDVPENYSPLFIGFLATVSSDTHLPWRQFTFMLLRRRRLDCCWLAQPWTPLSSRPTSLATRTFQYLNVLQVNPRSEGPVTSGVLPFRILGGQHSLSPRSHVFSRSQMPFTYQAHSHLLPEGGCCWWEVGSCSSHQPCSELQGWKGKTLSPTQTGTVTFKLMRFHCLNCAWPGLFTREFRKWIFLGVLVLAQW